MADLGRTYQSKRTADHMASEASRLREMLQEREDEIERLREAMVDAAFALDQGRTQDAQDALRGALDGGGESP
jgi:hypothetical protein